jgi:hypothetical protein
MQLKGDTGMMKRKFLFLTLSLVLAFTILSGQITNVAYAGNGNHGKKHTEDWKKEDKLEKYLKPLLNVKVEKGKVIFKNGLVNKGWKNKGSLTGLYYIIKVYSNKNEKVLEKRVEVDLNARDAFNLKPGRVKGLDHCFDISSSIRELSTSRKLMAQAGKYKAEIHWYAKINGQWHTASVSKTFMLHKRDINWNPGPSRQPVPQAKPAVDVKLKAEKQDRKLNMDITLVNRSEDDIQLNFGSLKQYDIIISDRFGNVVYDTRDWMSAQMINNIRIDAGETYYFPKDEWHFMDSKGNRVPAGKYTVKVAINPLNKETLGRKYDLKLEDSTTIDVTYDDIKYDIDAILDAEVIDRSLLLDLSIRNRTVRDVTVQFRSGQRFKIKLFDKSGKKVYEYQPDSIQAIIPETLKANSTMRYEHDVSLPELSLAPGEYTVQADFNVYNIIDKRGNKINESVYSLTVSKTIELTELDVNKYAAVVAEPAIEKTAYGDQLTIPLALYNLSEETLSLRLNRPSYSVSILDSKNNVLFTKEGTVDSNSRIVLNKGDSLSFGEVSWNMKDRFQRRVYGDIKIEVTINADMVNVRDMYNSELKTVQKLQIPK